MWGRLLEQKACTLMMEKNRHTMNETRLAKVYEGNPAQISTLNGTYMK